jgi:hypothetical protein
MNHIRLTVIVVALTPAVIDITDIFWEKDFDFTDGIEEIRVCGVRGTGCSCSRSVVSISHLVKGSDVESEVLSKLVVWEGGNSETSWAA